MRYFTSIREAKNEIGRDLKELAIVYQSKSVQDKVVQNDPGYKTHELLNYQYSISHTNMAEETWQYGLSNLDNSSDTIYGVLNDTKSISDVIKKTEVENLDIITSNVDLSGLEVETANDNQRAFILKVKLAAYLNDSRGSSDYIFIDCPPSLSLLTVMALVSSNSLVVPLQAEFFALEGLTQLIKTIDRIKVNLNP